MSIKEIAYLPDDRLVVLCHTCWKDDAPKLLYQSDTTNYITRHVAVTQAVGHHDSFTQDHDITIYTRKEHDN